MSTQPKPTGSLPPPSGTKLTWDEVVAEEPKPTGEHWTDKAVGEIQRDFPYPLAEATVAKIRKRIADAISAALAAAIREQMDKDDEMWSAKRDAEREKRTVGKILSCAEVCMNCGVIQLAQIDGICTTCQRHELKSIQQLREQLAAAQVAIAHCVKIWKMRGSDDHWNGHIQNTYNHCATELTEKSGDQCDNISQR